MTERQKMFFPDESGHRAALRIIKNCVENPSNSVSILDAIKDACAVDNEFNDDFLRTLSALAMEGWKNLPSS